MFRASAHLLLIALGVVVSGIVVVLAIDIGIYDAIFHTTAQQTLQGWIKEIRQVVALKGSHIDLAVKLIGLASTVALGMLAFLKGLHFAEIGLPQRLIELIEHIKKAHLVDRRLILAPYATRNLRGDQTTRMSSNRLEVLSRLFRGDPREKAMRRLVKDVEHVDEDISVLSTNLDKCKIQRVTAHLAHAMTRATEANSKEEGSPTQVGANEAALTEIRSALQLNRNDLDALELAAKQAKRLNLVLPTQQYLERLHHAAQEQRCSVRQARALRYQAELLDERGTVAARREARTKLETALTLLGSQDSQSPVEEKLLELALAHEQLASLHITRGTRTLAVPHLDKADDLYTQIGGAEGSAGHLRVVKLRARLDSANDEPDETVEAEGTDASSNGVTHVTVEMLHVYEAPKAPGAVVAALPPFTGVTVLNVTDKWALIARRGKPLGYVPMSKLGELT
jgi:tetratricopeptide (TPR) repeat protein